MLLVTVYNIRIFQILTSTMSTTTSQEQGWIEELDLLTRFHPSNVAFSQLDGEKEQADE